VSKGQAAANRLQAMFSGDYVYAGRDCPMSHGGKRYTLSKHCVQCNIDRLMAKRLAKKYGQL